MNKGIKYGKLLDMKDELKIKTGKDAYGLVCSEKTKDLLNEHCKTIAGMDFYELTILHGLKIRAFNFFPDDTFWVLDKEDFEGLDIGIVPTAEKHVEMIIND